MTTPNERVRGDDSTAAGIDRRTILQGATVAGLGGASLGSLVGRVGAQELPNTIRIQGNDERTTYEFAVSGDVVEGPEADGGEARDSTVRGIVDPGGVDDFRFSGVVTDFESDAPVTVTVNGVEVADPVGRPGLPNLVTVRGAGERVEYTFAVSGDVLEGPEADGGEVRDSTVRGIVDPDGVDDFRFSGDIQFGDPGGPLQVTLEFDAVPDGGDP